MYVKISLGQLFDLANLKRPEVFTELFDTEIQEFATDNNWIDYQAAGLKVLFAIEPKKTSLASFEKLVNEGVIVITHRPIIDSAGNPLKLIVLENYDQLRKMYLCLGKYIRAQFTCPTVAITGSVGKTTTTDFVEQIFKYEYNVFSTKGNLNSLEYIVREMGRKMSPEHNLHIQEIGGGVIESVSRVASIVNPDYFIITTILPHHMNLYRTFENIIADKTSLDEYAKDDAVGIVNIDNDAIREHNFKHKIVTCGIEHKEADYVAENIRQVADKLVVDIVHNGKTVTISASIPGKHNAYNMLLAYALAVEKGVKTETIIKAFSEYRSGFIRQNLTDISGRTMLIDCFNHSVDSIKAGLQFVQDSSVNEGNRKIAIIGGENALGEGHFRVNYNLGLSLGQYDTIDEFIFFGCPVGTEEKEVDRIGDAYAVYEGAKRSLRNKKISYCSSREEIAEWLHRETIPGDIILFKGIIHYPLWPAIDIAFGTALTLRSNTVIVSNRVKDKYASGVFYKYINEINLATVFGLNDTLRIPNTVSNIPVFRLGRVSFRGKTNIENIDFGMSLKNIGVRAFEGCTGIKTITVPVNVLHVDEHAFCNCTNLTEISFKGVEHIEAGAFEGCTSLKKVCLPENCYHLDENVFEGCSGFTIYSKSKYVQKWAEEHSCQFIYSDHF